MKTYHMSFASMLNIELYFKYFSEKKGFLVDEFLKRFYNGNFSVSITIYWPSQIRLKYVIQLIILNLNNISLKYDFLM
jgi:hypothetical protein